MLQRNFPVWVLIGVQFIITAPFDCIIKVFMQGHTPFENCSAILKHFPSAHRSVIIEYLVLKSALICGLANQLFILQYVIFNAAQRVYHPVGICWVQSSRDEHSQLCIWPPTEVGNGGWGVGGNKVRCPLGCRMNTATAPNISSSQCNWKMLMAFLIA